jgi:hypothetical protein
VQCRNYGCRQRYREENNADDACQRHTGPPIFHDAKKAWSCCPETTAWDWDGFMEIRGCARGRHSTAAPAHVFAASPTVAAAAAVAEAEAAAAGTAGGGGAGGGGAGGGAGGGSGDGGGEVKSIDAWNAANPDAPSSVGSLAASLARGPPRKRVVRAADGAVKCIRYGCGVFFTEADNGPDACRHHASAPVFWEGSKWWSCCPRHKHMEFEAFMAEPGCCVGAHEPGDEE